MIDNSSSTEEMLLRISQGESSLIEALLRNHRKRLRQIVYARMDPRLAGRLDASDVVQDTLFQASQKLANYFDQEDLPFFVWLRGIAVDRLITEYRRHIGAAKRSVDREVLCLAEESVDILVDKLVANHTSPSRQALRKERRLRVRQALDELQDTDRELLVMRYLEQLEGKEISGVLGISERSVRNRHVKALERLGQLLDHCEGDISK